MTPFRVQILAADHPFYEGECYSLMLPTSNGMYGIQARHSNTITAITAGTLRYRIREDEVLEAAVSGGSCQGGKRRGADPGGHRRAAGGDRRQPRPPGRRRRPGGQCSRKRASWSTARPRPPWPGRSAACGSSTTITRYDRETKPGPRAQRGAPVFLLTRAQMTPQRTALTFSVKKAHSSFFSSSRRSPFLVMR